MRFASTLALLALCPSLGACGSVFNDLLSNRVLCTVANDQVMSASRLGPWSITSDIDRRDAALIAVACRTAAAAPAASAASAGSAPRAAGK